MGFLIYGIFNTWSLFWSLFNVSGDGRAGGACRPYIKNPTLVYAQKLIVVKTLKMYEAFKS